MHLILIPIHHVWIHSAYTKIQRLFVHGVTKNNWIICLHWATIPNDLHFFPNHAHLVAICVSILLDLENKMTHEYRRTKKIRAHTWKLPSGRDERKNNPLLWPWFRCKCIFLVVKIQILVWRDLCVCHSINRQDNDSMNLPLKHTSSVMILHASYSNAINQSFDANSGNNNHWILWCRMAAPRKEERN